MHCMICTFRRGGCKTSEEVLWKLEALQRFARELHWPDEHFADFLQLRLQLMAAHMIEQLAKKLAYAYFLISALVTIYMYS